MRRVKLPSYVSATDKDRYSDKYGKDQLQKFNKLSNKIRAALLIAVVLAAALLLLSFPQSPNQLSTQSTKSFNQASKLKYPAKKRDWVTYGNNGREGELVHLTLKDVFAFFPSGSPQVAGDILGLIFVSAEQPEGCAEIDSNIIWTTSPVIKTVKLEEVVGGEYELDGGIEEVLLNVKREAVVDACLWSFGRCAKNIGSGCAPNQKYLTIITDAPPTPTKRIPGELRQIMKRLSGKTLISNAGNELGNAYHFIFDYMYSLYQVGGGGISKVNSVMMNQLGVRATSRFFAALRESIGGIDVNGDEGWWKIENALVSFGTTRPLCVNGDGCNGEEESMINILRTGFLGRTPQCEEDEDGAGGWEDVVANTVVLPRANRRTLVDPEVLSVFEQYGEVFSFDETLTGDYTPADFYSTGCGSSSDFNIVVGVHGANMANVMNVARPEKTCVIEIAKEKVHKNPRIGGLYDPILEAIPVLMYESYFVPESCDDMGGRGGEEGSKCYNDQMKFAERWTPMSRAKFWDGKWRREYRGEGRDDDIFVVGDAFEVFTERFVEECKKRMRSGAVDWFGVVARRSVERIELNK
ncbi:hypothetical protein TrLO_g5205 [Triparma laevis f. longispina]|uniref:Uncharacterized protein n=1 Tax=Triparma laevis f. longispina TaxID=1714387 RepID=A0A9W7A7Z0_9STRA|nr:hypothetical protein TrLO_g5205 [Triparma laevis f. longispina]